MAGGPPQGTDVEVKVKGERFEPLEKIANSLKEKLYQMDGVYDIRDDFVTGKSEIRLRVKEDRAYQYGLNIFQIAYNVRNALEGNITTTYRDADESIDVVVKYDSDDLQTIANLEELLIPTPNGTMVPLRDVAEAQEEGGYSEIRRFENEAGNYCLRRCRQ